MSNEVKAMIITSIYFGLNISIIIISSILLAKWGMGFKHSIIYAILFSSVYETIPMLKGFFKGFTGRLK